MWTRKWHRLIVRRSALAFAVAAFAAPVAQASVASEGGSPAVGVNSAVIAPDDNIRVLPHSVAVSSQQPAANDQGGFDWRDSGIAAGVVVVLMGASVAIARSRHPKPLPQ